MRGYPPAKGQEPVEPSGLSHHKTTSFGSRLPLNTTHGPSLYPSITARSSVYTTLDVAAERRLSLNDAVMLDVGRHQNPSPTETDTTLRSIAISIP